jgi:hypothetical protein
MTSDIEAIDYRLCYRRINRMSRLSPQTERCNYIASLRSLYTRTAALYLSFTLFLLILFGFTDFREFFIYTET